MLRVEVEKILCAKNGWYLFKAQMGAPPTAIVCKGAMDWTPSEKDSLDLTGDFIEYKGERQYKFNQAQLALPDDPRGRLHYVCTRTMGIGSMIESRIWEARGDDWEELEFGEVKMPQAIFDEFKRKAAELKQKADFTKIIAWLIYKGCTEKMAYAAYNRWELATTGIITQNCYALAELPNYSFAHVDNQIRRNFDIADNDARRIKAAIYYAMTQLKTNGNTAVDCSEHWRATCKLLTGVEQYMIIQCVKAMRDNSELQIWTDQNTMAIGFDFRCEADIYNWLQRRKEFSRFMLIDRWMPEIKAECENFKPDDSQLEAVKFAILHSGAIINGGAGVGKTSVIKMIIKGIELTYPQWKVCLCAPTGKAAARLKEATRHEATTIHLLLGADGKGNFRCDNLHDCAVIVDEASMVDSALMAELIRREPEQLILVGDQAQLPPVGDGQPFHDMINLAPEMVKTLTKCYRNKEAVFNAAMQIRNGKIPARHVESEKEKWTVVPAANAQEAQTLICNWAETGEIDFTQDIVLCPKNGKREENEEYQDATVNALNEKLLAIDRKKRGAAGSERFEPGDRVINTKNCPDERVWNGTTGAVLAASEDGLIVLLDTPITEPDGKTRDTAFFDKDMILELRHAYALTVHKSQGSQYRKVFIVILRRDAYQLDRSLIYTAVTRAQQECVIVGDYNAMATAIQHVNHKLTAMQCIAKEKNNAE